MAQSADLDLLRQMLRMAGPLDSYAAHVLDVATAWVEDRVYATPAGTRDPEVTQAILQAAARWLARRNSPEGVVGMADLGVIRILSTDPDIVALLEHHLDMDKAGIA